MQYHECKIHINFENATDIAGIDGTYTPTATLYADYIYLDSDERKRYAQNAHEYLIEQLQFTGDENVVIGDSSKKSQNVRLNFNHPVKYLAWVVAHKNKHGMFNAWKQGDLADQYAPIYSAKLLLNGHDRFSERKGSYFSQVQPFQHWQTRPASGVYAYSFALRPADQTLPSGSCNFSRIDNATLQLTFKQANVPVTEEEGVTVHGNVTTEDVTLAMNEDNKLESLKIYAINYNVLRILSGMGGLAYLLMRRKGAGADSWIKRICGNSFSNRSTLQPLVGTSLRPRDTSKLRGTPDSFTYQGMMSERPSWQRMELWYGKNREDWKIRSDAPTGLFGPMGNVQRSYGSGWNDIPLKRRSRPFQILRKEGCYRLQLGSFFVYYIHLGNI